MQKPNYISTNSLLNLSNCHKFSSDTGIDLSNGSCFHFENDTSIEKSWNSSDRLSEKERNFGFYKFKSETSFMETNSENFTMTKDFNSENHINIYGDIMICLEKFEKSCMKTWRGNSMDENNRKNPELEQLKLIIIQLNGNRNDIHKYLYSRDEDGDT